MSIKNRFNGNNAPKGNFILLVDDNPDDVMLTIRHIRAEMIENEVVVAEDGQAALEYLFGTVSSRYREALKKPCVVLLDLRMRRVNGFQVLEKIRQNERTKDLPVFVLTMSSDEADMEESYRLGANSYFIKWVSAAALGKTIKNFC